MKGEIPQIKDIVKRGALCFRSTAAIRIGKLVWLWRVDLVGETSSYTDLIGNPFGK
jgi:hypothetical protein